MSEKMTPAMKEALRDLQSTGTTTAAMSGCSIHTLRALELRNYCQCISYDFYRGSRFHTYRITPAGRAVDLGAAE